MNPTMQLLYQGRHPQAVLVAASFAHAAEALNALFNQEIWARDEDLAANVDDATVDMDSETWREELRYVEQENKAEKARKAAAGQTTPTRLQWRAPTETLRGPCTLWKETHTTGAQVDDINSARRAVGWAPLSSEEASRLTVTYTVYILVCAVPSLIDQDFQVLTRIADRHNCTLGAEAIDSTLLVQIAFTR